jgi:sec-independent protein translocase protein TatA
MSVWHLLLLTIILVVVFGPSRLEKLGPSLGRAIRGFKEGLNGELEGSKTTTTTTVEKTDATPKA